MNGGLMVVKRALSAFYAHDDRYMTGGLPEYADRVRAGLTLPQYAVLVLAWCHPSIPVSPMHTTPPDRTDQVCLVEVDHFLQSLMDYPYFVAAINALPLKPNNIKRCYLS